MNRQHFRFCFKVSIFFCIMTTTTITSTIIIIIICGKLYKNNHSASDKQEFIQDIETEIKIGKVPSSNK